MRIFCHTGCFLRLLTLCTLFGTGLAHAGPFAYISNRDSNNVSVIDTATNTVVATVPVGASPQGVAVNPAGTFVYVANNRADVANNRVVSVIDTATNTVVAKVPMGDPFTWFMPYRIAVNRAGTFAYVVDFSNIACDFGCVWPSSNSNVSVIDTATNTVVATVMVGINPGDIAINPAGTFAYVTSNRFTTNTVWLSPTSFYSTQTLSGIVSVINTATNTVVATVPVEEYPQGIAVNPAGTFAYVANRSNVSVIDTATNTVVATVPVGYPQGVAINPAGTFVYVTNFSGTVSVVSVIDTATNTVVATVPAGSGAQGIAVNPAGTFAYVANEASDNVSVIDTATNTVVATVPVGKRPSAFGNFIGGPVANSPAAKSGIWWNPNESGRGLTIQRNNAGITFAAWFTYDESGRATWYHMPNGQPVAPNVVEGEVYHPAGPSFALPVFDPRLVNVGPPVGRFRIEWQDNVNATFTFDVEGVKGTTKLRPYLYTSSNERVILWNPNESGWGFAKYYGGTTNSPNADRADFAVWYTYDEKGATWFVASDSNRTFNGFNGWNTQSVAYRYSGPPLAPVFDPGAVKGEPVGSIFYYDAAGPGEFQYSIRSLSGAKRGLVPFRF